MPPEPSSLAGRDGVARVRGSIRVNTIDAAKRLGVACLRWFLWTYGFGRPSPRTVVGPTQRHPRIVKDSMEDISSSPSPHERPYLELILKCVRYWILNSLVRSEPTITAWRALKTESKACWLFRMIRCFPNPPPRQPPPPALSAMTYHRACWGNHTHAGASAVTVIAPADSKRRTSRDRERAPNLPSL